MFEVVKQNRLEAVECVCWFITAVAFLLAGNYLLTFVFLLLFLGKFIQLYGKVKKSKEYDKH